MAETAQERYNRDVAQRPGDFELGTRNGYEFRHQSHERLYRNYVDAETGVSAFQADVP